MCPFKLLDFWRWIGSDLTNNAMRGVLAKFIVAPALGCAKDVHVEWGAHDRKSVASVLGSRALLPSGPISEYNRGLIRRLPGRRQERQLMRFADNRHPHTRMMPCSIYK